jgi:Rrf2 family protein
MKLITKHTDYAIRALVHLAERGKSMVAASEISKSEGVPERFLKKLLGVLKKERYIWAKEGKGGGVGLEKDPGKIHVSDVMKLFQGDFKLSACMFRKDVCPNRKSCVLRGKMKVMERNMENEFKKITISSLVNRKGA